MNRNKLNSKKRKKKQQCNDEEFNGNNGEIRLLQEVLYTPDHILKKIFRKDGPPLGDQFDSLPAHAFHFSKRRAREKSKRSHLACPEKLKAFKRRKVYEPTIHHQISNQKRAPLMKHGKGKGLMAVLQLTNSDAGAPVKKHGKGKGLMAVLQVTNPDAGDFPMDIDFGEGAICPMPVSISKKPTVKVKKKKVQRKQPIMKKLGKKLQEKRKLSVRRRKVDCLKTGKLKQPQKENCELALEGGRCQEHLNQFTKLVDDEELELRELQAGPNPLICSAHFATNGMHGCSFCKDLLAKFPPNFVAMKKPLYMQPWDSSSELVKKLFKVFHFLYTYAAKIHMHSFTLDEFAQAFHDEDSLLLGRINMALLKLLLSDVEMELSSGFISHLIKNCNFLGLLHSVKCQDFILNFWKKSLNPMTWPEILRQLLVAAGFGLKHSASPKEAFGKEVNLMSKYGLRPGTLKGELFNILLLQGNNGLKVSELAKSMPIVELNLAATTDELELLISSMLSSDITLFEKISSSAYRLRISSVTKECENDQSDSEDFGSVDDDSKDGSRYSSSDDSEFDSAVSCSIKSNQRSHHNSNTNMLVIDTEIDESHPGKVWLLGLTEGEYSELSIEEKLNALVALIDLLSAGSSIRMEDPVTLIAQCGPNINRISSGGKIKRSTAGEHNLPRPFEGYIGQALSTSEAYTRSSLQPVDSSASLSKVYGKEKSSTNRKDANNIEIEDDLHPMQSIYLGSDRRYNRYWLFLGPCNDYDPGHKRIYFESSEDGQWEVIDTEEALSSLLSALDHRGSREAHLLSSLKKREASLCSAMSSIPDHAGSRQPTQSDHSELNTSREDSSSAVSDVDNNLCLSEIGNDFRISTGAIVLETEKKREQQKQKWSRLQAFDLWIWNSFYSNLNAVKHGKKSFLDSLARCEHCHDLYWRDEKHCKICHTTFELDFDLEERYAIHAATCRKSGDTDVSPKHKVLSSQLQSLKAATYAIESVMPEDALVGAWTKSAHNLWIKRLRRTSTLVEFLQVLADFVSSINEDWLLQCNAALGSNSVMEEIIAGFPTMLQTSSAAAIWLFKLDSLIAPYLERVHLEKDKECTRFKVKVHPCSRCGARSGELIPQDYCLPELLIHIPSYLTSYVENMDT